jgi:hypothetical protein
MKPGDLVRDLGTGDMGIITDTYMQPQLNQLFIKMLAAGRETGWIRAIDNIEPVQDERDVVEWEHQSRRRNESVRGR